MHTEADVCRKFVIPSIYRAGWDTNLIKEQFYFTDGRVQVTKHAVKRKEGKKADYLLFYKSHLPLAVIEAKDQNHTHFDGMEQAIEYAEILDIPFAYSTDGRMYLERNMETGQERELAMEDLPRPEDLYRIWSKQKGFTDDQQHVILQNLCTELHAKEPRYYQRNAINRATEAVLKGQDRILLVMATGTGKTFTAFHIIHKLWKAGLKKRILYLADRNILIDDPMRKDFSPFKDKMVKVSGKSDISQLKSYEVFLSLYQALTGEREEDDDTSESETNIVDLYKQFSPDFFDLIIIDECHRGSAKANSSWRKILDYFDTATHLGMTATPKNNLDASNYDYFGDPVYVYSLKQGIDDGFLAPYRVINYTFDVDAEGYRPQKGEVDKYGNTIEDRNYNTKDFDRTLVIDERIRLVAHEVSKYLKSTDRMARTIIFCQDTEHAAQMRSYLQQENSDIEGRYVVRITGNEKRSVLDENLYNFIDKSTQFPVIATTSKLLTTGVDTKTVKVIVLDANISSLSEFKQIIGRGTRIDEDAEKMYFTIIDFRKVTNLFADPDFDGEAVGVVSVKEGGDIDITKADDILDGQGGDEADGDPEKAGSEATGGPDWEGTWGTQKPKKYYVREADVNVLSKRTQILDEDGKLINVELEAKNNLKGIYESLDDFMNEWNDEERRKVIIEELRDKGVYLHEVYEEYIKKHKQDIDMFDLILYLAFDRPPLTRKERANNVQKRDLFGKYSQEAQAVLKNLLNRYADNGIEELESLDSLELPPINQLGTPLQIVELFGGVEEYKEAIRELEKEIYKS